MPVKTYVTLFICIGVCLVAYLYFVDVERKKSIENYFATPQVGDIYKIKSDVDGDSWMSYFKVTEVYSDRLVFFGSKLMADASSDYTLNHYDTTDLIEMSREDLSAIKNGKWKNSIRKNTSLIEIMRRH